MDVQTHIFTSKPVANGNSDSYRKVISDSLRKKFRDLDFPVEIKCATRRDSNIIFIYLEIIVDVSIDTSKVVRRALNQLFQDAAFGQSV